MGIDPVLPNPSKPANAPLERGELAKHDQVCLGRDERAEDLRGGAAQEEGLSCRVDMNA